MTTPNSPDPLADIASALPVRTPQRVRHPLRFRTLEVRAVERVTPHLVRVTLGGDALEGFASPGFDDHVKLVFPDEATGRLATPSINAEGKPEWPPGPKVILRDYTPRRFDAAARTLEIDFALHEAGPATRWAGQAQPGQQLGVGGPRGSFIVPMDFDWHLLVGDDTALPAISRRLAELPNGSRALVLVEVDGPADHIALQSRATVEQIWVHRDEADANATEPPLLTALRLARLPGGDFHGWVGCESAAAKAVRAHLVNACHANPKWIRASGYWRRGSAATHDSHDE